MKKSSVAIILLGAFGMSGCSTLSFAPPPVNIANEMEVEGSNLSHSRRCMPEQKLSGSDPIPIGKDAEGAMTLTNNFIYYYRCASHSAGNGRQAFEIPAFLTLVGTATAAAFGAGSDVVIAGGAANATLDGAKDYYAPMTKASIYDSALDAFLCIKSTAAGVQPFVIGGQNAVKTRDALAAANVEGYFEPERQYFELVSSSLFTVERIAADRIRSTGRYDPAGVVAQIQTLSQDVRDAQSDENSTSNAQAAGQIVQTQGATGGDTAQQKGAVTAAISGLDILQPKLELCVLRAKL